MKMQQLLVVMSAGLALSLVTLAALDAPQTRRVSVNSAGGEGNQHSRAPAISADGRFVAFASGASNLVGDDANGTADIFVHDLLTDATERVSVDSTGQEANSFSFAPAISADGRHIAFISFASNLVANDTNGTYDVFVHDRATRTTERISVSSSGNEGNSFSLEASISGDGAIVAFSSFASNLVADTNDVKDVFVRDRRAGTTERVSVSSAGAEANGRSALTAFGDGGGTQISADGRFVTFESNASNLVPGGSTFGDVFVRDRQAGTTERVSLDDFGNQIGGSTPSISADGRYVSFLGGLGVGTGGPAVLIRDRLAGTTSHVSIRNVGELEHMVPALSADGRFVAFASDGPDLVAGDTNGQWDVFVQDRQTGATERVSVSSDGAQANGFSFESAISGDGRLIAFASTARNLVPDDTNQSFDIFVRDRGVVTDSEPPVLTVPADITVNAVTAAGAQVTFTASATDAQDPAPVLLCTPASGSLFPIGTTSVSCTATDAAGNAASATFLVHVTGGAEQNVALQTLIVNFDLAGGMETSLTTKLRDALLALEDGDTGTACTLLADLQNQARAQAGKKLTLEQAAQLQAEASRIRAVVGCR